MGEVIVSMKNIVKTFPGVKALDNVNFELRSGEVMALLGENGAGKSTLMKILSGVYTKDGGTMTIFGKEYDNLTPKQAQAAGVAIIHQELNMCRHLSVAENMFLGREKVKGIVLKNSEMEAEAAGILGDLKIDIDPRQMVGDLPVSKQQMVEYQKVTEYICAMAQSHRGNYMVFFPSYGYMEQVERKLKETCEGIFLWQAQKSRMTEAEREDFLDYFQIGREASFVGLCVLGGIFSEGIDLREDRLEGVIVVGTGLPMVCPEQEILKDYFDQREGDGYDYAYQYPGMNKVLQAAGRVIRTEKDQGVILLLDDRFLRPEIQGMFPREWSEYVRVTRKNVRECLERFWKEREAKS